MDTKLQKMTDIVAKLLRQAEDVVGTPEEHVFHAKAFEIMAKYGLDIANIEAHKSGLDMSQLPDAIKWLVRVEGKYAYQQLLLLHSIATAMHCKTVYNTIRDASSDSKVYTLSVFGVDRHVQRVEMLWSILRPQMLRLVGVVRPEVVKPRYVYDMDAAGGYRQTDGRGQVKAFRRAWIAGFGSSVGDRIRMQESKVVESAGGGALVLYRNDVERAEIALRQEYPFLGKSKRRSGYNSAGYSRGRQDGQTAAFNHSLTG